MAGGMVAREEIKNVNVHKKAKIIFFFYSYILCKKLWGLGWRLGKKRSVQREKRRKFHQKWGKMP